MSSSPLVSVVFTAHREGFLVAATLKSLARAIAAASERGVSVEVLVSLDRSDGITKSTVESLVGEQSVILENDFGDPALCRNRCVGTATGEYIAILDGDDLIGSNWLYAAVAAALIDQRDIVWHPEVNVVFGEAQHVFCHMDMEADGFDPLYLVATNPWTSLCFAKKKIFLDVPYPPCDFTGGIGHEDWAWNRFVVERGYLHKVVAGTGHAIRRRLHSYVRQATSANVIPAPTKLFRNVLDTRGRVELLRRPLRPFRT
ncbi:MAG: glycosyltransferase family 2 protein [Chitinophagaceae bacterium]|jgi:hypothetical protein|nr:glycosyltransferase family 2 protein [Chitinophagaceae bacterium]